MIDMTIYVIPCHLSDGSDAYDVKIGETILAAVTMDDAADLAAKIRDAIDAHTVSTAKVIWED